jgi:superoxide oxidase
MKVDVSFDQRRAHEVNLAPLCDGAWTHEAPIKARHTSFDGFTIGLHWATVLLVLALLVSGWLHALAGPQIGSFAPALLQIHRSAGVTLWLVTVFRLGWRLTKATLPPFPTRMTRLHRATVKCTEYGLYALLLSQPSTGLLSTLFGARPFALFAWQFSPLMRDDMLQTAFLLAHEFGAWALAALAASHAAAALFHHFVLRDDVLERMAPVMRQRRSSQKPATNHIVPWQNAAGNKRIPTARRAVGRSTAGESTKRLSADTSGTEDQARTGSQAG